MQEVLSASGKFEPLYYRIQQLIRWRIVSGAVPAGGRLPSEPELAREFNTTRLTVRHALARLDYEGLIVRRPGRGTFVAQPDNVVSTIDTHRCYSFEQQVAGHGKVVTFQLLSYLRVAAPMKVAKRLAIDPKARVYRLERLRFIDDRIAGLETRYILDEFGRSVSKSALENRSVYDFMSDITGERIPCIEVSLTAIPASKRLAAQMDLPVGSPLVVRYHVYRNTFGRAVLSGQSVFPGNVRTDYVLGLSGSKTAAD